MSESKLNLKRLEPLLAAFAMDHEKSQPVEVGFFHDRFGGWQFRRLTSRSGAP